MALPHRRGLRPGKWARAPVRSESDGRRPHPGARASRPHAMPMRLAQFPCDVAPGHPAGVDAIDSAEAESRCRLLPGILFDILLLVTSALGAPFQRFDIPMAPRFRIPVLLTLCCLLWVSADPGAAEEAKTKQEPEAMWLFPLGGQRGTSLEVEIRGKGLQSAYAVVAEEEGIRTLFRAVEEIVEESKEGAEKQADKKEPEYRVRVGVEIDAAARPGDHWLRVVTPGGISDRVHFRVNADRVIRESADPHDQPDRAQAIEYPVVVNGQIDTPAEMDFYQVEVVGGQELLFEVTRSQESAANVFRSQISIHGRRGSWFDPDRVVRLAFSDKDEGKRVIADRDPRQRTGTRVSLRHRFPEAGRYLVEVGSLGGQAKAGFVYQLRVAPPDQPSRETPGLSDWTERSFVRKLTADRLRQLWSRGVRDERPAPDKQPEGDQEDESGKEPDPAQLDLKLSDPAIVLGVHSEKEPGDRLEDAVEIPVPSIVEGVVQHPGDSDLFKFKVHSGQKLAFEVETPQASRPDFNPLLQIIDSRGRDQFSSLRRTEKYRSVTAIHLVAVDAKVIGTFEKGGDYYLRVRDVTLRKGDPGFRYRVLVRPQIPHVGDIHLETRTRDFEDGRVDPHRVNLMAGEAAKLTLIMEQEEGFFLPSNQIAVSVEGLPAGVEALAGASSYRLPGSPRPPVIKGPDHHLPKVQTISVVLHSRDDVAPTHLPVWITVTARPIVGGRLGPRLTVKKIPLTILDPNPARKLSQLASQQTGGEK